MYRMVGWSVVHDNNPGAYFEYALENIADYQANRIDELLSSNVAKHLLPSTPASLQSVRPRFGVSDPHLGTLLAFV